MQLADNPQVIKRIVKSRVKGNSTRQIETETGIDHSTVARALNKPLARQMLEKAYYDLVQLAPHVYDTFAGEIKAIPAPSDMDGRKLRVSVAKEVAAMIGLSPVRDSHNNVFFTNIIAPTQVTLSPLVSQLLSRLTDSSVDEDTVDVEYVAE
jgi:hypothetical protein